MSKNAAPRKSVVKPVTLTIQNMSVVPDSVRGLFPEEGYLFMKPVSGAFEVWQYSYGSEAGVFREKVSEDVGITMIKKVKEWNRVAADLDKQLRERAKKDRQLYLNVINQMPDVVAGFSRIDDELFDTNGKLVYTIRKEDLKLASFAEIEARVYTIVFGIDKLDF